MKRYTGKNTESDRLRITGDPKGNTRWQVFNSDVIQAFELDALLDVAETIVVGGLAREESRGAHYRGDFPQRDDGNWLKHLMAYQTWQWSTTEGCAVTITRLPPKEMRRFHALMMSMEAPVIMEPLPLLLESFSPRRQCKQS